METREANITLQKIESFFYQLLSENKALALWRNPKSDEYNLAYSDDPPILENKDITTLPPSFIIAPFESHAHKNFYAIPAENCLTFSVKNGKIEQKSENFNVNKLLNSNFNYLKIRCLNINKSTNTSSKKYTQLVTDSVLKIREGHFKKVVISRAKTIEKDITSRIFEKYIQLTSSYPDSFVSLTYTPATGLWLGASPEILIQKTYDSKFKTMALAGTQASNGASEKNAVWKQKEIEEQAYVSRYIINRFKEIRLREFEDIGPRTVKAGDLFHLQTDFIADMEEVGMPNLPEIMRLSLHPTSAVCGMPREAALNWIKDHEGYDRKLYSGYLGPVNVEQETSLYVNLRCAEIHQNSVTFYAGAGITADSDPESEFRETELKMKTLENILLA